MTHHADELTRARIARAVETAGVLRAEGYRELADAAMAEAAELAAMLDELWQHGKAR